MKKLAVFAVSSIVVAVAFGIIQASPDAGAQDDLEERVAALETRVAELETRVSELQSQSDPSEVPTPTPTLVPTVTPTSEPISARELPTVTPTSGDDTALVNADAPAAVGETVTGGGIAVTLLGVEFRDSFRDGRIQPDPGFVFMILDVRIEAVGQDVVEYSDDYFSAKDMDEGYKFDNFVFLTNQPLGQGRLSPDDFVRGEVLLEVRTDSRILRVKYDTDPFAFSEPHYELFWLVERK